MKLNLFVFLASFFVFIFAFAGSVSAASGIVVNAGGNRQVNQTQSILLSASAYDVNGFSLTYSWSCTGGSLSSSAVLSPTYYAPPAVYDTSYACTLTVRNIYGIVGSDTANILVKGMSNGGAYTGNNLYADLSASPSSGTAPLTGVNLAANVTGNTSGSIVYKFDCNNDGSWEVMNQTSATSYTAYGTCNYYTGGTYTARVLVENNGKSAARSINISVTDKNTLSKNNNLLSVDAGSNVELGQGQTATLNGSYFDVNYYNATSFWSCTGGSLSTPYSLTPTYTAPNISADTTYICTLYVTNNHGTSNSDSISVTVRKTGSASLNATTDGATASTTSATLYGTIVGDSGMGVAARFAWGTDATYGKVTDWSYGNRAGSTVSSVISGLAKGKAYHYRIEIYNGSNITFKGKDMVFVTQADSPTDISASTLSASQIKLSWVKGSGSCYTMVVRNKNGYPTSTADGAVAYYGTANSFNDKNLSSNTTYYYRIWAIGCGDGLYSFSDSLDSDISATTYSAPVAVSANSNPAPTATGNAAVSQNAAAAQDASSGIILEVLARNITQGESDWQDSINANPSDEIEFNAIVTPSGNSDLRNVALEGTLSDKIGSVSDLKLDGSDYSGDVKDINVGKVAAGNSQVITFRAKVSASGFDYGSTDILNSFKISADDASPVSKDLTITVTKGASAGASLSDAIGKSGLAYMVFSILTFLVMLTLIFYLIIDRRKIKRECAVPDSAESQPMDMQNEQGSEPAQVKKSKYFVIK